MDSLQIQKTEVLDLSDYALSQLPENIIEFSALRKINLSNNQLLNIKGIEELNTLEELILDGNLLLTIEDLLEGLSQLQNLKRLSFSNSELIYIPTAMFELKQLEMLNLQGNQIKVIPNELRRLKNLKVLNLKQNEIENSGNSIQHLKRLEQLDLSYNPLSGAESILLQLAQLKRLKTLYIDNLHLENTLGESLKIKSVRKLFLSNCDAYTNTHFLTLFSNVEFLDIQGTSSEEEVGELIAAIEGEELLNLNLLNPKIKEIPSTIFEKRTLVELRLKCQSLENFSAQINRLSSLELLSISEARNLQGEEVIRKLIPLNQLKKLDLIDCNLTSIHSSISKLSNLYDLNLNGNELTQLPLEMKRMTALAKVELKGSKLEEENIDQLKNALPNCKFILDTTTESKPEDKEVLNPPLAEFNIDFDTYFVDANEVTSLITASKTQIVVPRNAFLDADGNPVNNNVRIVYREFSDPIDMVFAGVPMTTNIGGEEAYFSSAGMMEFRAYQNNQELFPNPESPVTINYNSPFQGNDYNLYYLDPKEEGWAEIGKDSIAPAPIEESAVAPIAQTFVEEYIPPPQYPIRPYGHQYVRFSIEKAKRGKNLFIHLGPRTYSKYKSPKRDTSNKVYSESKYLSRTGWILDYKGDVKAYKKKLELLEERIMEYNRRSWVGNRNFSDTNNVRPGLNLVEDYWLEPNPKGDNFHMVMLIAGERLEIPVLPNNLPRRAEVAQRKVKQIYSRYRKHLNLRRNDWAIVSAKYSGDLQTYDEEIKKYQADYKLYLKNRKEYRRQALEDIKTYQASEANVIRSFRLNNFGVFNVDVIKRMQQPKRLLAKLTNDKGDSLNIKQLYILDKEMNGIISFNRQSNARFDPNHTNGLIAILSNGKIGVLNNEAFNAQNLTSSSSSAVMQIFDSRTTTILELRQNANFF